MIKVFYTTINGFSSDINFSEFSQKLSDHINSYANEHRRICSIVAYKLLNDALKRVFKDISLDDLLFSRDGKPYLKEGGTEFSISHSGELAFVGISDEPIGIDVEKIVFRNRELFLRCFSNEEKDFYGDCSEVDFYKLWTAKESVLKLSGEGLKNFPTDISCINGFCKQKNAFYKSVLINFNNLEYSLSVASYKPVSFCAEYIDLTE